MTSLNPVVHRRAADRRGAAPAPRDCPRARRATRTIELLELVGIPAPERRRRRVPAPALRRHAPARDDRDGGRVRPEGADRRRADDRARRDDPGGDPRPAARHPRAPRHGDRADHARPRRRRRHRRPGRGHVRRAQGRGGARSTSCSRTRSTRTRSGCWARCRASGAAQHRRAGCGDPRPRARRCARAPDALRVRRRAARARTADARRRCRRSTRVGPAHLVACFHPGEAAWNGR